VTKLITQFGENLAPLIVQMSIAQSHSFCRLVMVNYLSFILIFLFVLDLEMY
jgi:hypothetical protein